MVEAEVIEPLKIDADLWSHRDLLERIIGRWFYIIEEMNDYQFKLAKIKGEFIWHKHKDTDETFIVLEGQMTIKFRDGQVTLDKNEMYVVPKGVEHKPYAEKECHIMLIEPRGILNTGEEKNELTAMNDNWI